MKVKNLLLLAGFGLFTAQAPILQASEDTKRNSFVDTAPARIIKWSGAITGIIICGTVIYYVPSILKNLHDATDRLNTQTVTAWTQAGIAIEKDAGSIVKTVDDFSEWLKAFFKDPLTFNLGTKANTLQKISDFATRELPPLTEF